MNKTWQQKDNTDKGEKIVIRQRLLSGLEKPSVLECFAGDGKIYRQCYQGLPYLGLDLKPIEDGRTILKIDNRRYLRSADLSPYNFFDLDAYGSPWHQFMIVFHRRKIQAGEKIAVAITDGLDFKMRMSSIPTGMRKYLGLPPKMSIPCLHNHHDFISQLIVSRLLKEKGLTVLQAWTAKNPRGNMDYHGLLLQKTE